MQYSGTSFTLSLPVTRICVNFSTVYNDTLVVKGLKHASDRHAMYRYSPESWTIVAECSRCNWRCWGWMSTGGGGWRGRGSSPPTPSSLGPNESGNHRAALVGNERTPTDVASMESVYNDLLKQNINDRISHIRGSPIHTLLGTNSRCLSCLAPHIEPEWIYARRLIREEATNHSYRNQTITIIIIITIIIMACHPFIQTILRCPIVKILPIGWVASAKARGKKYLPELKYYRYKFDFERNNNQANFGCKQKTQSTVDSLQQWEQFKTRMQLFDWSNRWDQVNVSLGLGLQTDHGFAYYYYYPYYYY